MLRLLVTLPATLALIAPTTVRTKVQLRDYTLDDAPIGGPLEPVANYILVKIDDGIDATKGGVFLPDQAKEKPSAGIVVAAGEGKSHPDTGVVIPNPVGEGDRVLYGKFDGTSVKYNGEDHQLIKDDGTLAASRGAFTSFKRVVSGSDGRGWSFFRVRGRSDRVDHPRRYLAELGRRRLHDVGGSQVRRGQRAGAGHEERGRNRFGYRLSCWCLGADAHDVGRRREDGDGSDCC